MKPWILLDTTDVPGGGKLRLLQRDGDFAINLGADALMGSRMRGSEEALAQRGCAHLGGVAGPAVLIGGLGMGFTLRAALPLLDAAATVVVAELVPAVVAWARGPLAGLHGTSLDDPRVTIREGDVGRLMRAQSGAFDAILLDVDNGPEGLTREANDALYDRKGLRDAWTALRPGGVLAVWSVAPDAAFTDRLRGTEFRVEEVRVRAQGKRGSRHVIWLAVRPGETAGKRTIPPQARPAQTTPRPR